LRNEGADRTFASHKIEMGVIMEHFRGLSYEILSSKYIPFIYKHFNIHNIMIKDGSRFSIYKECLDRLASYSSEGDWGEIIEKYGMGVVFASLKETIETYDIFKIFEHLDCLEYVKKLSKIATGNIISDKNEIHTEPRDYLFELFIAAQLKNAGYYVQFAEPDIVIRNNSNNIYIACKRPNSENNLENSLKKAKKQIIRKGRGLIALSLDKLLNKDFGILKIRENESYSNKMDRFFKPYIREKRANIKRWIADRKVFGIIYTFGCVSAFHDQKMFTASYKITFDPLCPPQSPFHSFILKLNDSLKLISR